MKPRSFMKFAALGLLLAVVLVFVSLPASADTTIVVQPMYTTTAVPSNVCPALVADNWTNGWATCDENATTSPGTVTLAAGPGVPPLGTGSAQFNVNAHANGPYMSTVFQNGLRLDDITQLTYDTYHASGDGQDNRPVLQLNVDYDLTDSAANWQGRLIWIPKWTGCVTLTDDTWQTMDPMNNAVGCWLQTGTPRVGDASVAALYPHNGGTAATWSQILAAYPNAGIHGTLGAIGFKIGSGEGAGKASVDNFKVGFDTGSGADVTTWDFDPDVACTTTCYADAVNGNDANGGASADDAKKTIGAAVTAVQAGGQVIIAPGTYPEKVTVTKSLTLSGAGNGTDPAEDSILEGTGLTGSGIFINNGIEDVTVENLRVQNYILSPAAGVYANAGNNGLTVQNIASHNNGTAGTNGGGIYMNGPVDDVLIDGNTITDNRSRGIVIWNGFKTNITITNNTVSGNNCCGIELQDGTASGVTATGNTVSGNVDSGMAFIGLTSGAGANLIANNTVDSNGRFGIEIKLPNGTGLDTGDGSIVVEDNTVSLTTAPTDLRDYAGIAVIRRGWVASSGNVDIPTGVIVRDNTVSGYQQVNVGSFSTGFGIVVEGTNMHVSGNTLNNNDVGVQVQAGHLPYTANSNIDGNQNNVNDDYFGRGNSPIGCVALGSNTFTNNTVDSRNVGAGGGVVTNIDTRETFCSIQAAIDDSNTDNGDTIEVSPGTYAESPNINKSLTLVSTDGRDATTIDLQTGPTYLGSLTISGDEVTVDGFTIQGFDAVGSGLASSNIWIALTPDTVVIKNNRFQVGQIGSGSNGDDGIGVVTSYTTTTDVAGVTIEDNIFEPVGVSAQRAFYVNPGVDEFIFRGNEITGNFTAGSYTQAKDGLVEDNTITGTGTSRGLGTWGYPDPTVYGATTFTGNTFSDVANGITIYASENVTVEKNIFTGNGRAVWVDEDEEFDLSTIHINRNSIDGNDMGVENWYDTEIDAQCNWWGAVTGPSGEGTGSGDAVGEFVAFTPWLFSANLNSDCYVPGTITVVKQTNPDGDTTQFTFDPSWGANFTLSDGQSLTSPALNPEDGPFSVAEIDIPANWALDSASCTNGTTTADPSSIPMVDGESWTCTFENDYTQPVGRLYVSPNKKKGTVGGVNFTSGDILLNIIGTDNWSMFFDGSDVGLKTNLTDYVMIEGGPDNGCMLMTFNGNFKVPGVWTFKAQDIAKFCPTSTGDATAGTWSVYFDGSDVGLNAGAEKIDGLAMTPDGDLIISTKGNFNLKPFDSLKGKKSELLRFSPTSLGENTNGTWAIYYSNPLIPKKANPLSLDLIDDDIYMSVWGNYTIGGVAIDDNDVFIIHPDNTVTKFWDGAAWGYTYRIMGLHIDYD